MKAKRRRGATNPDLFEPLYSVRTWDAETNGFTTQEGLSVPSLNVTWRGLLAVLRELRSMGYSAHYRREQVVVRSAKGDLVLVEHDTDPFVLVERTDGKPLEARA